VGSVHGRKLSLQKKNLIKFGNEFFLYIKNYNLMLCREQLRREAKKKTANTWSKGG
jgi:hypothetical protein